MKLENWGVFWRLVFSNLCGTFLSDQMCTKIVENCKIVISQLKLSLSANTAEIWPCFCNEMQKVWQIKLDPPKIWGLIRNGNGSWWKTAGYEIFSPKEIVNKLKKNYHWINISDHTISWIWWLIIVTMITREKNWNGADDKKIKDAEEGESNVEPVLRCQKMKNKKKE